MRADSGFCLPELLALWEHLRLPSVVVAQLSQPIQRSLRGDLQWTATELPDTDVAELESQALRWPHPRRLVLIRHRVRENEVVSVKFSRLVMVRLGVLGLWG